MRSEAGIEALSAVDVEGATGVALGWTLEECSPDSIAIVDFSIPSGPTFVFTSKSDSSAPCAEKIIKIQVNK